MDIDSSDVIQKLIKLQIAIIYIFGTGIYLNLPGIIDELFLYSIDTQANKRKF